MIKFLTIRILRWRLKNTLPKISSKYYKKLFTMSYKFFYFLKPSQLWVIVLALLNKTEFKNLVKLPSMFLLFSSLFNDSTDFTSKLDDNIIYAKLDANNFLDSDNNWEKFFWFLIAMALIKIFIKNLFKLLWFPFKIALIYYFFKYIGYDLSYLFNTLNTLSLGIVDWFYIKITNFIELLNKK